MYLIVRYNAEVVTDYFGPFPSEARAHKYAEQFEDKRYAIVPLIVPNCVQVKLVY